MSKPKLAGRCRNCGGRKDRKHWYCEGCRGSMKIPKKEWGMSISSPSNEAAKMDKP